MMTAAVPPAPSGSALSRHASFEAFRSAARRRLPSFLFEYIDGGALAETTLARNVADLAGVALRQRVLRGAGEPDLSCELFGQRLAMPVILAPIGLGGLAARRGERQAVRAARAAGVPFTLSTVGTCTIEEVAAASDGSFWFQLYMMRDRAFMRDLLARARDAGCPALVFTVDMPVPGRRTRDYRTGLAGAAGLRGAAMRTWQALCQPRWAWDVGLLGRPHTLGNVAPLLRGRAGIEDFMGWLAANFDPAIGWKDLDFIRAEWPGPLILKGILDAEDAREALRMGADGIVVSNHGGRQLDGVPSTARALPAIVDAVGDGMTVLADGGVRSGLDVVRLLALGAKGVMLGRAWAWALGAAGEAGVARMLDLVAQDMRMAMTLTGARSVAALDRSILCRA